MSKPDQDDGDSVIADDEGEQATVDEHGGKQKRKEHTYLKELERRGISRESQDYKEAIVSAMLWIRLNKPFYGFVIDEMTTSVTLTTRTAHVRVTGGGIEMAMNPDFMALLTLRHRAGVIMHECLHVMNLHLVRIRAAVAELGSAAMYFAGIAADLAVNSLLSDPRDLPKSALRTTQFLTENGSQFPARDTFEEYMRLLMRNTETIKVVVSGFGGDEDSDSVTLDDHDVWLEDDGSLADNEILSEVIKEKIRRASNRAQARGVGLGDCQDVVDALLKDKTVDFGAVFQGMIGRHVSQTRRPSMLRPSKRYGQPPGRVSTRKLHVTLYMDVSGSMHIDEIKIIASEARHAEESGMATVSVQQFDWGLQGRPISVRDMGQTNVAIQGRGGTSLREVIADIDKNRPDLAIIGTDGGLEHDLKPESGTPVVWLLTSAGRHPGWGQVLRLPSLEDIRRGKKAIFAKD